MYINIRRKQRKMRAAKKAFNRVDLGKLLRRLKLNDYDEYLKTAHWRKLRRMMCYPGAKCCACDKRPLDEPLDLHHQTYRRLGRELECDVLPMCRECHEKLHNRLNEKYGSMPLTMKAERTGTVFRRLFNRVCPKPLMKRFPQNPNPPRDRSGEMRLKRELDAYCESLERRKQEESRQAQLKWQQENQEEYRLSQLSFEERVKERIRLRNSMDTSTS